MFWIRILVFSAAVITPVTCLRGQQARSAQEHAERAAELVHAGDLRGAERELRNAVELSPGDPALLTSLGGVLGMEGDPPQANVYLTRAVKLNPLDATSRRNLAANQWQLGRLREAHENLDRLLRGNPKDKIAASSCPESAKWSVAATLTYEQCAIAPNN